MNNESAPPPAPSSPDLTPWQQEKLDALKADRLRKLKKIMVRLAWNPQGPSEEKRPAYEIGEDVVIEREGCNRIGWVKIIKADGRLRVLTSALSDYALGEVVMIKDFAYEIRGTVADVEQGWLYLSLAPFRGDRSAPAPGGTIDADRAPRLHGEGGCEYSCIPDDNVLPPGIGTRSLAERLAPRLTPSQLRRREQKAKREAARTCIRMVNERIGALQKLEADHRRALEEDAQRTYTRLEYERRRREQLAGQLEAAALKAPKGSIGAAVRGQATIGSVLATAIGAVVGVLVAHIVIHDILPDLRNRRAMAEFNARARKECSNKEAAAYGLKYYPNAGCLSPRGDYAKQLEEGGIVGEILYERPKCEESSEPISPKTGWKRKARIYRRLPSGPCYELTYSKPGHQDVVSHACDHPLPSFAEDNGTRGVILGHVYASGAAPYSNGPEACR